MLYDSTVLSSCRILPVGGVGVKSVIGEHAECHDFGGHHFQRNVPEYMSFCCDAGHPFSVAIFSFTSKIYGWVVNRRSSQRLFVVEALDGK